MDSKAKITATAPTLLVSDMDKTVGYWRDKLGFEVVDTFAENTFAIMKRDDNYVMFGQVKDPSEIIPNWKIREKTSNIYFWTDDVESLYKEYKESGAPIDWDLYTAPYGVKEFGINDPDGYDIAFGEILK